MDIIIQFFTDFGKPNGESSWHHIILFGIVVALVIGFVVLAITQIV